MSDTHKKTVYKIKIDGNKFEWNKQFITGFQLKSLGEISIDNELYLNVKGNSKDELILNENNVDLANPGIEKFYSKEQESDLVSITIDDDSHHITKGEYTGLQIKQIGNVNSTYELQQVVDGLKTINDGDVVNIVGGEVFISHPKDGQSS